VFDDVAVVHVLLRRELAANNAVAGGVNLARTTVTCPGLVFTVSLSPVSQ